MVRAVDWPIELLDRVRWLWDQGLTALEISEKVNKSRNAIIGKMNRARNQGADIEVRNTSNVQRIPKKKKPKPVKEFVAPAVKRAATNGSGKRLMVPPSSEVASPPPILEPIGEHNGWHGVVAEVSYLQSKHCRWPLGEPVTGFCRAPLNGHHLPYCEYHYGKVLRKPDKRAGE